MQIPGPHTHRLETLGMGPWCPCTFQNLRSTSLSHLVDGWMKKGEEKAGRSYGRHRGEGGLIWWQLWPFRTGVPLPYFSLHGAVNSKKSWWHIRISQPGPTACWIKGGGGRYLPSVADERERNLLNDYLEPKRTNLDRTSITGRLEIFWNNLRNAYLVLESSQKP